jgi:hypothetical protein
LTNRECKRKSRRPSSRKLSSLASKTPSKPVRPFLCSLFPSSRLPDLPPLTRHHRLPRRLLSSSWQAVRTQERRLNHFSFAGSPFPRVFSRLDSRHQDIFVKLYCPCRLLTLLYHSSLSLQRFRNRAERRARREPLSRGEFSTTIERGERRQGRKRKQRRGVEKERKREKERIVYQLQTSGTAALTTTRGRKTQLRRDQPRS